MRADIPAMAIARKPGLAQGLVLTLPITAVGKVDKKALRAELWAGEARNIG